MPMRFQYCLPVWSQQNPPSSQHTPKTRWQCCPRQNCCSSSKIASTWMKQERCLQCSLKSHCATMNESCPRHLSCLPFIPARCTHFPKFTFNLFLFITEFNKVSIYLNHPWYNHPFLI